MHIGKIIRMERLFNRNTGKTIIVPMDHGVSEGLITGLEDLRGAVSQAAEGGADAVVMHKGLSRFGHRGQGRDIGLILHLSSSTSLSPRPNFKTLTATVEDALKYGADGVSIHVNLGDDNEAQMLSDFGKVSRASEEWNLPLLAMIYGRGPKIRDGNEAGVIAHCARVAVELGADIIKVPYTGNPDSFHQIVKNACVPVVIAGGPKCSTDREFLEMVHQSVQAGGAGLSVGRNIFQHPKPRLMVRALSGLVHQGWSVDKALASFEEK